VLAAAGADVLVTRVPATSSIPARAAVLREKISEVYPGRDVHLVGHSMGGLDCRYLVHQLMQEANEGPQPPGSDETGKNAPLQRGGEYRREGGPERTADEESKRKTAAELKRRGLPPFRVLSLTTIATPHRGSAFADYFLSTLGRKRFRQQYIS
jgi:triacylglycerol lipase